jgi:hypothetical protein
MRTKIKALLATMTACLLGFTGCSSAIKEGTIVDKEYRPSHYTYVSAGKIITPIYISEQYFFTVEDEIEGESQQNRIEVSCEDYYSYKVGDWYSTEN